MAGKVTKHEKLSRGVVLPVFFRQADACVVARRGFDAMVELNPQLDKQLRVIATSPKFVPATMVYHKDCPAERKTMLSNLLRDLHVSEAGRQAQMLFNFREFVVIDASLLQPSLDLLAKAARLKARAGGARQ